MSMISSDILLVWFSCVEVLDLVKIVYDETEVLLCFAACSNNIPHSQSAADADDGTALSRPTAHRYH